MNKIIAAVKRVVKKHYLAILISILVGLIYFLPNIVFIVSSGEKYRGIPMMLTPNEDFYLARVQEITDGHPTLGSFVFYEYKNQRPLSFPTGEFFYALPTLLFGVTPANVLIISRFILSVILFLLVYVLIGRLTGGLISLAKKFKAISGAYWVTLGYDLVDFRGVGNFLAGKQEVLVGSFLIWSRPINPVIGAILLFSFLLSLLALWQKTKYHKTGIIFAGLFLALMMASYFFSWGMALSVWGVLIVMALVRKQWPTVKSFFWVLLVALLISSPYWYMSWQASQSPWYKDSILRYGIFYTHYPLANKLMLATLALYLILVGWSLLIKNRPIIFSNGYFKKVFDNLQPWHWFCLAFILGSLWAYSQQIITGVTIWPYHFVQYSIPLAIMVIMVLLFNIIKEKSIYFWGGAVSLITAASLFYGIYAQVSVYKNNVSRYVNLQSYAKTFDWLNEQAKDCVVLVKQDVEKNNEFNRLVPAFTHCNSFISTNGFFSLLPESRLLFSYLAFLRLNDVKPENIESYLAKNRGEARSYLFSNWQGLYGVKDFPDFSDELLEERIKKFPRDYREFYTKDFRRSLSEYRLDYIIEVGDLKEGVRSQLPDLKLLKDFDGTRVYQF